MPPGTKVASWGAFRLPALVWSVRAKLGWWRSRS